MNACNETPSSRRTGRNAVLLCLLLLPRTSARATDYQFNSTSGTSAWSTNSVWTPNGIPTTGDNIDYAVNGASSVNLTVGGVARTVNNITKTGTQRWDIIGQAATLSTLNVQNITIATTNMIFRDGNSGGGLQVNTANITVTAGTLFFGSTSLSAANLQRGLAVSGTTTVSGGALLVNVDNPTDSYTLGLLNVSGAGVVSLNNAPFSKGASTGGVTGLNGAGGFIQTAPAVGQNGNTATLAITNNTNYSSATVLRDGANTNLGTTLALSKAGPGTQTLTGANTFTGATSVTNGVLILGNAAALGARTGIAANNGDMGTNVSGTGTLDLGGQTGVFEVIRLNGTGFDGNGALINSGAAASIANGVASLIQTSTGGTAPTLTISGGGGTGATATVSMGVTTSTFTINGGTTVYSTAPTVTISSGGAATQATATANLTAGVVTSITIATFGAGYTSAPAITFSGGTVTTAGTNPTGTGNATNFAPVSYSITNGGSGFTSAPTVGFSSGSFTATAALSGIVLMGDSSIGGSGDITVNGTVIESGGPRVLTKTGTNTLTLASGGNSYSGATIINGGAVAISADEGLGTAPASATPGHITLNGGGLNTTGTFALSANRGIALNGTGGQINVTSGALTYDGIVAGVGRFEKTGAGTLTMSGANSYSGGTLVSGGVLRISADGVLGEVPGAATPTSITLNGGTLATTADFSLEASRGISLGASGGTIDVAAGTTLGYGGSVSGAGNLSKAGTGTLNFTTANGYSGVTTVSAGTLAVSHGSALGTTASGTIVASNGTLAISGNVTIAGEALSLTGDGAVSGAGALRSVSGSNTWTGNITVTAGATRISADAGNLLISGDVITQGSGNFNVGGNGDIEISGVLSGPLVLFKSSVGTGTLTLSNAGNTYTGITTIGAGTVKIFSEGNLGATPGAVVSNNVRIRGGVLQTTATMSLSATRGVLLSNGGGGIATDAGTTLTVNGVVAGANTDVLVKTGAGTLMFTAANTYSGGTTVSDGTVLANNSSGSALGTGSVTVGSAGKLGGDGSVALAANNFITINGALMVGKPGDTSGVDLDLSTSGTGSTILGTGSFVFIDIFSGAGAGDNTGTAAAADVLRLSGDLSIGSGVTLRLGNPNGIASGSWMDGDLFRLFDWSGLVNQTGTFSAVDSSDLNLPSGWSVDTTHLYTTGTIGIVGIVPEPGRGCLVLIGALAVFGRRRRV